jgi:hypothetical protein
MSSRSTSANEPSGTVAVAGRADTSRPAIGAGRSERRIVGPRPNVNAASSAFESSRTLPGQS